MIDRLLQTEKLLLNQGRLIKKYQDINFDDPASMIRMQQLVMDVVLQATRIVIIRREDIECDYVDAMKRLYDKLVTLIIVSDMPLDFVFEENCMWDLKAIFNSVQDKNLLTAEEHAWNITEALSMALTHTIEGDHMMYYYLELAHFSFIEWCVKEEIKPEVLLI